MRKTRVTRFKLAVPCPIPFSTEERAYEDYGLIVFPDNYSEKGPKTRLVINCHGAGGTVSTDDSQIEQQILTQYLVANGFAVMDVNGLPQEFAKDFGVDIRNNIGGPIAIRSYIAAYRYCMERYNLMEEVVVHGGSMGGISSTNLVLSGFIPVVAQTGFCPVLDTFHQIFCHPWSEGLPKTALGILYSLDRGEDGQWIYEEDKIIGLNPAKNPKRLSYPCPLLFCHCADDPTVAPWVTQNFVNEIKASGREAELLLLPKGGHEPQLEGEAVACPCGKTELDGVTLEILPAVEAVFQWILDHSK